MEIIDFIHFVTRYDLISLKFFLHVRELRYVALMESQAVAFHKGRPGFGALKSSLLPLSDLSQLRQAFLNFKVNGVPLLIHRTLPIQIHLA